MKVQDFSNSLQEFQRELEEHSTLWRKSLNPGADYPSRNTHELEIQARGLCRHLGALRPFIERFDSKWVMHHRMSGTSWDTLDAATGMNDISLVKGPSLQSVLSKLDRIIGRVETLNPEDDIPADQQKPIRPGSGVDQSIGGYLHHLHPCIVQGCAPLFNDGHFAEAVEVSAKAVFQYLREKTGLTSDGADLVNKAFSVNKPILAFSDLADETKKNEQIGFMDMLKGYFKGVRSPRAHTHGKQEEAQKAFEFLVLASLFCRRIDDASSQCIL